jgi:hypothetical protein
MLIVKTSLDNREIHSKIKIIYTLFSSDAFFERNPG